MKLFKVILLLVLAHASLAESLTIGVVTSLTGVAADYGQAVKNGVELAIADAPDKFTKIKFIFEDAGFSPSSAIVSYKKLSQVDKARMILTWGVSFCKALAPVAESDRIPLVGICMDPTMGAGREYAIRFKNSTDDMMKLQLESLSEHKAHRIGLILSEHPYLNELALSLKKNLLPHQSLKIINQVSSSESDFRSILLSISPTEFDSIGVFLFADQIATFYKQARDLKIHLATFGTDFFESQSIVHASNGTMEGKTFAALFVQDNFIERYKSKYRTVSQLSFAAAAYEFARLVGDVFNETPSLQDKDLLNALLRTTDHDGYATGSYSLKGDSIHGRHFRFPITMKQIIGDDFLPYK